MIDQETRLRQVILFLGPRSGNIAIASALCLAGNLGPKPHTLVMKERRPGQVAKFARRRDLLYDQPQVLLLESDNECEIVQERDI